MSEYEDYGWDAGGGEEFGGNNYGWNPDGSDTPITSQEIPEEGEPVNNELTEPTGSDEKISEDTQSDLGKINHPNMSLEEVQELQGIDDNGHTTGEGTGNEAFKESLPEDYKPNEVKLKEGATMDDFNAKYDEVNGPLDDAIHDEWVERLNSENADRDKIGKEHDDGIGMEHTGWLEYRDDIKDNPDYFDEEGNFKWPENKGFANKGDLDNTSSIKAGREVTRYGFDTGHYMTDGSDYDSLAMPYKEEFIPKNTYTVEETIDNANEGKIADLQEGDGSGGGNQIQTKDTIEDLKREGKLKLNNN